MANRLGGVISAVRDVPTRRAIHAIGLDLDRLGGQMSAITRNNTAVVPFVTSDGDGITSVGDVGAGPGISVSADAVAVDMTYDFVWTGNHLFSDYIDFANLATPAYPSAGNVRLFAQYPDATGNTGLFVATEDSNVYKVVNTGMASVGAVYGGAGTSPFAGTSELYMREDAVVLVDQAMNPVWTGTHGFEGPQTVFKEGIGLQGASNTEGIIDSGVLDGASSIAFHLNDRNDRTLATAGFLEFALDTGDAAKRLMQVTPYGEFAFGYKAPGGLSAEAGVVLVFNQSSTERANTVGGIRSIITVNSATSITRAVTIDAVMTQAWSSGASDMCAVAGKLTLTGDTASASAAEAFCFGAQVGQGGTGGIANITGTGGNTSTKGNWARVSTFRAGHTRPTVYASRGTNLPAIITGLTTDIPAYCAISGGQQWGVEIISTSNAQAVGNTAGNAIIGGAIKLTFPERGTNSTTNRLMHAYWVPYANTAARRANNAPGDTYFDDGTNFASGLWQRDAAGWVKLLNDDLVFWENEIVSYEDESVGYH